MADLSFSQAERRNFVAPALVAFAVLAILGYILFLHTPMHTPDLSITHTSTLPTHTVYSIETKLVCAKPAAEDAFFVLTTVSIHNRLHVPLFIDTITCVLTASDGAV